MKPLIVGRRADIEYHPYKITAKDPQNYGQQKKMMRTESGFS